MSVWGDDPREALAPRDDATDEQMVKSARQWYDEQSPGWNESALDTPSTTLHGGTPLSPVVGQALTLSTVYRGVAVVSSTIGRMPIRVRYEKPTGGYEKVAGHWVNRLMRKPNGYMTGFRMMSMLAGHLVLRGNAYVRIESGQRWAERLIPLHPDRIVPWSLRRGEVIYRYTPPIGLDTGRPRTGNAYEYLVGGTDIIHIRGLVSDDGIVGLSVLDLMRRQTETVRNMELYGRAMFSRFPMLRGIIEWAGRFNAQRRKEFQDSFRNATSGPSQWGGIRVLDRGMKWTPVGLTAEQTQWLEARTFAVPEFARWIGVPTSMLMHTDKTSLYANVDRLIQAWGSFDLAPWLVNIEQELTEALLPQRELDLGYEIDLDDTFVLRGSPKDRAVYLKTMVEAGVITPNEAREYERLAPMKDGDELRSKGGSNGPTPGDRDRRSGEDPEVGTGEKETA